MHFTSAALVLLSLIVLALCAPNGLITVERTNGPTSGRYIITLKKDVDKTNLISQIPTINVTHNWDIIHGFAGHCDDSTLDFFRAHSGVESIVEDGTVSIQRDITQYNAPWGLERISHPARLTRTNWISLNFKYTYDQTAGAGVDIYIVDSGIYVEHNSFQGRARWGATFGGYEDADNDGHGTHCAGIAASYDYGVAKGANLIAVKVIGDNGHGYWSDVISGMNWIQKEAASSGRPSVASMSITGHANTPVDNAVASLTNSGVHVVAAAGNENDNASNYSPPRAATALTVAAIDITDTRWSFSNYGSDVNVFAPGVDVESTWIFNPTASRILTGTSMAAPHVSGIVAYLIKLRGDISPTDMITNIEQYAVPDKVKNAGSHTVNLIAQNRD